MTKAPRDHGGGLDAAALQYGGDRSRWLDLSTGINPVPYPIGDIPAEAWTALPDQAAFDRLIHAARHFWNVPKGAQIVPAPGASSVIARIPGLLPQGSAYIPGPTYNEHAAAFRSAGFNVTETSTSNACAQVFVHPNNPTGAFAPDHALTANTFTILDESFCDVTPERSLIQHSDTSNTLVLKSFGKFWGLAGLRLGFAICAPTTAMRLRDMIGPWPVAGPALTIGAQALQDTTWAKATRIRLANDADRMDKLMAKAGASLIGGTTLFRLYDVGDAAAWQDQLARNQVWSRIFPYSSRWLRLGLPAPDQWDQLEAAL